MNNIKHHIYVLIYIIFSGKCAFYFQHLCSFPIDYSKGPLNYRCNIDSFPLKNLKNWTAVNIEPDVKETP